MDLDPEIDNGYDSGADIESDHELEDTAPRLGARAIAAFATSSNALRYSSKKAMKTLKSLSVAPGTAKGKS